MLATALERAHSLVCGRILARQHTCALIQTDTVITITKLTHSH